MIRLRIVAIVEAAKPIITEIRAPKMTRERMSLPTLSVPIQYLAEGSTSKSPV